MPKFYFTFRQIDAHSVNGKTFDKDCVAVMEGKDYIEARKKMFDYFGRAWHRQLSQEDFEKARKERNFISYFPRGLINVEEVSEDE